MEIRKIYLIKDLSQLTGYSVYTIKYYIKLGLIKEVARSAGTNFRYFDDTTINRLKEIRKLRCENMSLKDIKKKLSKES